MRYKETRELRMVLPLMAKASAGFHPLSYAVWYEYVAGNNPQLQAAVDTRRAANSELGDKDIQQLFDQFVAMRDIETSARMRNEIQKLVEEVKDVAVEADAEVKHFGDELTSYQRQLTPDIDQAALTGVVKALLTESTRVRDKTEVFQEHLKKSTQEVVRLREELEMVQGLALTDPLTGLLNRRGFDQQARSGGGGALQGCSMLMIDIDNFKAINDQHGHLLGDKVIAAVAQVLKNCVANRGRAARIGGEEFAVLLQQTPMTTGAEVAERIRATVQMGQIRRADSDQSIGAVTVSIGVAPHLDGEEFESLFGRADRALYQSKQGGRNRVSIAA
jgi:diguanylate cyclase